MVEVHADIVNTTRSMRASRPRARRRRTVSSTFVIHEDSGEEDAGDEAVLGEHVAAQAAAMARAREKQAEDLAVRIEARRLRDEAEVARLESPTKLLEEKLKGVRMR
jgi:hypothetical protein